MELQITNNCYKGSNNELNISNDFKTISAYSYNWWRYITTDSVGNIIFNETQYSHSTSRHQSNSYHQLFTLGIRPTIVLSHTVENLAHGIANVIDYEIENIKRKISQIQSEINKKGSWESKNETRERSIY